MNQGWVGNINLSKDGYKGWVGYIKLSKDESGLGRIYQVE